MNRILTSIISYYNTSLLVIDTLNSGTGLSWFLWLGFTSMISYCSWWVHWWPTPWSLFDWVLFESWPSVVFITLAFSLEFTVPNIYLGPASLDTDQPRSIHLSPPASCCPWNRPSPWTHPRVILDLHMPESQPPVILDIGLWTLPQAVLWDRCHEPCPSVFPQHQATKTHTLSSESGPSVTPTLAQSRLLLLGACHRGEARAASPDGSLHQS